MYGARWYIKKMMHLQRTAGHYPAAQNFGEMPLYVHIPFCESLCPFCPFHRVLLDVPLADSYFVALEKQVDKLAEMGYAFNELYIGGGTPTTRPKALTSIIRKATGHWPLKNIAVETNPNHLRKDILLPLRDAGVTRLSVGVQSLNDKRLEMIGRLHAYGSSDDILRAIDSAQGLFPTFNVDMIFNFPDQTERELLDDIAKLKESGVDQISYYPLMPSPARKPSSVKVIDDHKEYEYEQVSYAKELSMYERIVDSLLPDYQLGSVWCFNRKPQLLDEYIINNPNYMGIGSGAFSLLGTEFYSTSFDIEKYVLDSREGQNMFAAKQALSPLQRKCYQLLTGLFGLTVEQSALREMKTVLAILIPLGVVEKTATKNPLRENYVLTQKGRYWWLVLMREFFMGVNQYRRDMRSLSGIKD